LGGILGHAQCVGMQAGQLNPNHFRPPRFALLRSSAWNSVIPILAITRQPRITGRD
jgi:hypothetical protein